VKAGAELAQGTPTHTTNNATNANNASAAKKRKKLDSDSSEEEEKRPAALNLYLRMTARAILFIIFAILICCVGVYHLIL
jgi:hypothetical protein